MFAQAVINSLSLILESLPERGVVSGNDLVSHTKVYRFGFAGLSIRRLSAEDEPIDSAQLYTPSEKRTLLEQIMLPGMWRRSSARRHYYCHVHVLYYFLLLMYAEKVVTDGEV